MSVMLDPVSLRNPTLSAAPPLFLVMGEGVTARELDAVVATITGLGAGAHVSTGPGWSIVGVLGLSDPPAIETVCNLPGVAEVRRDQGTYHLASRRFHPGDRVIELPNGVRIGGGCPPAIMAGPCAVEDAAQLAAAADAVHAAGARILRGGAFKPRTSPYSFQGLGEAALKLLRENADRLGMAVVTEVISEDDVPMVAEYAEILQIGSRNMQNYQLLRAVGESDRPVLLKRGLAATIDEMLQAAEYILALGNHQVMLCERGIRTFESATRFTLDINAVPVLRERTSLPVIVDPSHATGSAALVRPVALAAIAAGADGLIIEVHPNPAEALCDGKQSLSRSQFEDLAGDVRRIAAVVRGN